MAHTQCWRIVCVGGSAGYALSMKCARFFSLVFCSSAGMLPLARRLSGHFYLVFLLGFNKCPRQMSANVCISCTLCSIYPYSRFIGNCKCVFLISTDHHYLSGSFSFLKYLSSSSSSPSLTWRMPISRILNSVRRLRCLPSGLSVPLGFVLRAIGLDSP